MLTDYSVLISESYDGQHKLLTEELKRKGTKVHICGDTEIELEIGAVKYTPDVIVIDCCKLGYKKLLHFREILHEDDIYPIIYNIYTYDDTETIRILLDYDDILHILMPYDAKNVCHYMLDKLKRIPVDPDILKQNISKEIHRIITSTGINRKHSGYDHIYYMIFLLIFKYNGNKVQIGELYKDIEKQYGKNTAAIERSTRSAIVSGWEKMKPVDKQMLFESCLANGTKPTNAMYINTIALYIKHLYNDQLEMYYKKKTIIHRTIPKVHTYYKGYALFLKGEGFMICSFSSLRNKEVVNMRTGLKIGYVDDIEMDTQGANIVSLIVYGKPRAFGIMGRDEDIIIKCSDIELIGEDTILVKFNDSAVCTKSRTVKIENLLK